MKGGESYLVSVRAIHDAMAQSHPALLEILYRDFPHWLVEGQRHGPGPSPNQRPIFYAEKRGSQLRLLSAIH